MVAQNAQQTMILKTVNANLLQPVNASKLTKKNYAKDVRIHSP
jgi:hypothetical protein